MTKHTKQNKHLARSSFEDGSWSLPRLGNGTEWSPLPRLQQSQSKMFPGVTILYCQNCSRFERAGCLLANTSMRITLHYSIAWDFKVHTSFQDQNIPIGEMIVEWHCPEMWRQTERNQFQLCHKILFRQILNIFMQHIEIFYHAHISVSTRFSWQNNGCPPM